MRREVWEGEGVTPAAYASFWRLQTKDFDCHIGDGRQTRWHIPRFRTRPGWRGQTELVDGVIQSPERVPYEPLEDIRGPVLCPVPFCYHEEPTPELAARHAETCFKTKSNNRQCRVGWAYYEGRNNIVAFCSWETSASIIVDMNFGGHTYASCTLAFEWQQPVSLKNTPFVPAKMSEPLLRMFWIHLPTLPPRKLNADVGVQKGWLLNERDRARCERAAFPRSVSKVVRTGDGGMATVRAWAFSPAQPAKVLTHDEWERTVVVIFKKMKGGPKATHREHLQELQAQGGLSTISVSLEDLTPEQAGKPVSTLIASIRGDLPMLTRKEIDEEYLWCDCEFVFVTFSTRENAERAAQILRQNRCIDDGHNMEKTEPPPARGRLKVLTAGAPTQKR